MRIFFLLFTVCSIEAQNSFELQYLGDYLSVEEATARKLCETKYCLSDAKYLFYAATQNKSVRPCDDFKEFALGTFVKYQTVNDRIPYVGFFADFQLNYYERMRRVLLEPVNVNDSRISKGIKTFFAKCVNSKNITKNGVSEARELARSFGLKFFPETNDKDFNVKNYIEHEGTNSLRLLFFRNIDRSDNFNHTVLYLNYSGIKYFELQLESYETMLYDMNQIFRNSSYSNEFKKEFKEIAKKQTEFYLQLKNINSSVKDENFSKWMTIEELNNLTSPLDLNWLTIINNQLFTKSNSSARIFVSNPESISKIAEFLAGNDKDAIADYLVYDSLYEIINGFLVYVVDKYKMALLGAIRPGERWLECSDMIITYMAPAFDALFLQRYFDKESEDSLRKFSKETIKFALKKFKSVNLWGEEVFMDVSEKLKSIKFIFGYSDEFVGTEMLEELYGGLSFDQNFVKILHQMLILHQKLNRESKTRELLQLGTQEFHKVFYMLSDNIIFIDSTNLNYPFFHNQRPRYYNTATVSTLMFEYVFKGLFKYLNNKFNLSISVFNDKLQYGYEFYESWLESGGEELNLGANRLKNQQLYWIAVARTYFRKHQTVEIPFETPERLEKLSKFHKYISSNAGFLKAFNCKNTK